MTDRTLINQLVAVRKQRGMTQRDVASRLNVTTSAVGQFETRAGSPTLESIMRYAHAVGADIHITVAGAEL